MTDMMSVPTVEMLDSSINLEHLVMVRKAMEGQEYVGMGSFRMLEATGPMGTYVDTYA